MQQLIPISKKQHDAINGSVAEIAKQQDALRIAANAIVLGLDEDIPQYGIIGATVRDGIYSLVIELPDIAPKAEAVA